MEISIEVLSTELVWLSWKRELFWEHPSIASILAHKVEEQENRKTRVQTLFFSLTGILFQVESWFDIEMMKGGEIIVHIFPYIINKNGWNFLKCRAGVKDSIINIL